MEKYYTAITYKNWERVGEPFFNDKGKLCTKVKQHNSVGYITKTVRLYTEKEFNSIERQKERAAERRLEEAEKLEQEKRAKTGETKANWLLENGFNGVGITYVYIADDSYNRKDELKAAGWRYHALIGWHNGEINVPYNEEDIYTLDVDTAAEFNMYGEGVWKYAVKEVIAEAKASLKAESRSEWVGKIGERLQDISVTLTSIYGYNNNKFGYSQVVKFETENKDELIWFTSSAILAKIGEKRILKGTVKKHDLYKGNKVTILTRCKII